MTLSTITRSSLSNSGESLTVDTNNLVDTEINTDISLDAFDFSVQFDNITLEKIAIQSYIEKEDINVKNYLREKYSPKIKEINKRYNLDLKI